MKGRHHHHHQHQHQQDHDQDELERWRRRWLRRAPRVRRLQARLFFWFLTAIVVAFVASTTSFWAMRGAETPTAITMASRHIAGRLARDWDDPEACDRDLERVRDLVGLELHLRRDVEALPHRGAMELHAGSVTFGPHGEAFIPVVRDGTLLGALEIDGGVAWSPHWNGLVALAVALLVLAVAARGVARRLAWPLEDVADAAERFGNGDLAARTRLTRLGGRRRWVADEVRGVAVAFDQMADRIASVVREQRELLGAISHELRSPLGRARVALEIARERSGDAAAGPIGDVERQLTDVDAILGDLLAAARAGLSDVKPTATPFLAWIRSRIATEPTPPGIELSSSLGDDVSIAIDAPLLNRALHNILANARAHGHPVDRPIEIRVESDPARVRIVARDHGPGFPADILARAFEPFVKGDAARTPGSGYGLGLALVRRIADAHGGRAFARNAEGGGAEVGMELPRERSAASRDPQGIEAR